MWVLASAARPHTTDTNSQVPSQPGAMTFRRAVVREALDLQGKVKGAGRGGGGLHAPRPRSKDPRRTRASREKHGAVGTGVLPGASQPHTPHRVGGSAGRKGAGTRGARDLARAARLVGTGRAVTAEQGRHCRPSTHRPAGAQSLGSQKTRALSGDRPALPCTPSPLPLPLPAMGSRLLCCVALCLLGAGMSFVQV